jgi:hypothetical protein
MAINASTKNTTNKIHAICVAVPATPEKPSTPAIRPMIRKVNAQLSIVPPPFHRQRETSNHDAIATTRKLDDIFEAAGLLSSLF